MKRIFIFSIIVFLIIILQGCKTSEVHQNDLVVEIPDGRVLVTVISEDCVHVLKSGEDEPLEIPEYLVVKEPEEVDWTVDRQNGKTVINTAKIKVEIDDDGVVNFYDKEGKLLLAEAEEFYYKKQDEKYEVSQHFLSGNEALYGLGQFQDGLMNWKNVSLRLKQFNQVIATPFLVSTNNYGILWDNYSITDFNPPVKEVEFDETVNEELNIRKTTFIPETNGMYSFFMESNSPEKNRFEGPILLTMNEDTVIYYSTIWVPENLSGKIELEAGKEYEMVFQNTNAQTKGTVSYNPPDYNKTVFSSFEGNAVSYYFIHGENPSSVIRGYRELTGQAPLFPKNVYGFWQCRERYNTQQELLENAREYRRREIPVDNIVQDWNYWPEDTWGPEWDRSIYPDPAAMINELEEMNLQLMVSVWPRTDNKKLEENYGLTKYKYPNSNYLDFFHPELRETYYQILKDSMYSFGVDYIWLDGTEPEDYPKNAQTYVGEYDKVANAYSLMVTRSAYEGLRKDFPDERVFNLTRSAFTGQQRYAAASWSGDVSGTWEQFAEQVPAGLNFSMAGLPYWTTDIGGFFRDSVSLNPEYDNQYNDPEYIELLGRWFQFGTFCPLFRIHGYKSNTEIWRYGEDFENLARKYINLRYRLLPYIYSEAWKVTSSGETLMRPLAYEYPEDENTWDIKDQYFFGSSIMVSPVIKYQAQERTVYLPEGDWFNFHTNEKITGGRKVAIAAPPDILPLLIKAGSIIPFGPEVQYAMQETSEPVELRIYPGKDAHFVFYLDDGKSYDYEDGEYAEISFMYSDVNKELTIEPLGESKGSLDLPEMPFVIKVIDSEAEEELIYSGERIKLKL